MLIRSAQRDKTICTIQSSLFCPLNSPIDYSAARLSIHWSFLLLLPPLELDLLAQGTSIERTLTKRSVESSHRSKSTTCCDSRVGLSRARIAGSRSSCTCSTRLMPRERRSVRGGPEKPGRRDKSDHTLFSLPVELLSKLAMYRTPFELQRQRRGMYVCMPCHHHHVPSCRFFQIIITFNPDMHACKMCQLLFAIHQQQQSPQYAINSPLL